MDQNLTHRNHYIPRFYLKNWSLDGKTIQTYSILVSNSKVPYWTQQSIKNSAVWSDFYTRIEGDKEIDDFEHWFDREFETPAKPVFDKLLNGQKISYEESVVLSHFVFAQYVRTPAAYLRLTEQNIKLFPKILEETTAKIVADGLFCREIDGLFCRSSPDIIVRRRCVLSHKRRGWLQPSPSFRYSRNLALQDELYHPVINNGPAVLVCVDKRLGTGPVNQSRDAG